MSASIFVFVLAAFYAILFAATSSYNLKTIRDGQYDRESFKRGIRGVVRTVGVPEELNEFVTAAVNVLPAAYCALAAMEADMIFTAFMFVGFVVLGVVSCHFEKKAYTGRR